MPKPTPQHDNMQGNVKIYNLWRPISSGHCVPKIVKAGWFCLELFALELGILTIESTGTKIKTGI